jgi:hypothetical protein
MLEASLYEENMEAVLKKFTQCLEVCEHEILRTIENMGVFDKWAEVPDIETKGSHQSPSHKKQWPPTLRYAPDQLIDAGTIVVGSTWMTTCQSECRWLIEKTRGKEN